MEKKVAEIIADFLVDHGVTDMFTITGGAAMHLNDAFGHTEGDRALNRVASAIKDACQGPRGRMFVSRYGGDEFVIVAEMAYRAEATYLAEQIKNNLRRLSDIEGAPYDISISIGIAQYDYKAPVSLQAFIARADSDLYQNKKINNA